MSLLIDGYNVLHIAGILGRGVGPGSLQRSRLAMLNFLAESLEPVEISRMTVVFDARNPPPGMPRVIDHRGITVRFAAQHDNADALIEELIRADSAPRRLTVVSSDHRIQRAARRRKARAVDADVWYAEVLRRRRERQKSLPESAVRPAVPLLEEDVNYWIRQFGGKSLLKELAELEAAESTRPSPGDPRVEDSSSEKPNAAEAQSEVYNPFPPGYAEDLDE